MRGVIEVDQTTVTDFLLPPYYRTVHLCPLPCWFFFLTSSIGVIEAKYFPAQVS